MTNSSNLKLTKAQLKSVKFDEIETLTNEINLIEGNAKDSFIEAFKLKVTKLAKLISKAVEHYYSDLKNLEIEEENAKGETIKRKVKIDDFCALFGYGRTQFNKYNRIGLRSTKSKLDSYIKHKLFDVESNGFTVFKGSVTNYDKVLSEIEKAKNLKAKQKADLKASDVVKELDQTIEGTTPSLQGTTIEEALNVVSQKEETKKADKIESDYTIDLIGGNVTTLGRASAKKISTIVNHLIDTTNQFNIEELDELIASLEAKKLELTNSI